MGSNMLAPARARIVWIDCLKGIGISLVVYGHIATNMAAHLIYLFHMPLFFFLSGYLHTPQTDFRKYGRKKAIHLLIPYMSFVLIASVMDLGRAAHHHLLGTGTMEHWLFVVGWGGSAMKGLYGVLWFLTCLFFAQQVANWLLVKFRMRIVIAVGLVAMLCRIPSLPLDINVAPVAMAFFLVGYLWKRVHVNRWLSGAVGCSSFVFAGFLIFRGFAIPYDLRDAVYGIPIISFVLAVGCILGCIELAKMLDGIGVIAKIGALSMGIMFIHKDLPGLPGYGHVMAMGTTIAFFVTLAAAFAASELISRYGILRALLLGSERDFASLFANVRTTEECQNG